MRQGSSTDMETLKSNLESAIERENDLKEQLKYAEEEAKMLRKRLRDIEHENEALTKQLKKLSQIAHAKSKSPGAEGMTSETIETEVIQLENAELRANNDRLHQEIESLQTQVIIGVLLYFYHPPSFLAPELYDITCTISFNVYIHSASHCRSFHRQIYLRIFTALVTYCCSRCTALVTYISRNVLLQ